MDSADFGNSSVASATTISEAARTRLRRRVVSAGGVDAKARTFANFTLNTYAHAMRRDQGDLEQLKALVNGNDWAPLGTRRVAARPKPAPPETENPPERGFLSMGAAGFEPATSRV